MAGVGEHERARPEHYRDRFTRATYRRLASDASRLLGRDGKAIVDATCHSRTERALLLRGLPEVRKLFVRCDVPLELALERVARRLQDPECTSDATPEIVTAQFRAFEELDELPAEDVMRLDGHQAVEDQVAQIERALNRRQLTRTHEETATSINPARRRTEKPPHHRSSPRRSRGEGMYTPRSDARV
jgi:predicted kinase